MLATAFPFPMPPLPRQAPLSGPSEAADACLAVRFAQGLPGFPTVHDYLLRPAGASGDLLVLAALGHCQARFLVLPYVPGWLPVDQADLSAAAEAAGIAAVDLAIVMMVNIRRGSSEEAADVTVNLRAPILIDTRTRAATQLVLSRPDYSIRHPLRRVQAADAARHAAA